MPSASTPAATLTARRARLATAGCGTTRGGATRCRTAGCPTCGTTGCPTSRTTRRATARAACAAFCRFLRGRAATPARWRIEARSRDPDVALGIDGDAAGRDGPLESLPCAAPLSDEISRWVEAQNLRGRRAADLRSGRIQREAGFRSGRQRIESAVHEPDVLFRVHGNARHGAQDPMIGQRLRPERINLICRALSGAPCLSNGVVLEIRLTGPDAHAGQKRKRRANEDGLCSLHVPHLPDRIRSSVRFLSEGRQYTAFGEGMKGMKRMKDMKGEGVWAEKGATPHTKVLKKHGALFFMTFTVFITFMNPPAGAHDIPADVLVQMLVKPEGNRMRVLLRVPLGSMRDIDFPQRGPGYLDFARARPLLRDAATLWLGNSLAMYEGQTRLAAPTLVAAQLSLPSDRSFMTFDSAVAHVTGPPLPDDTAIPWNQVLFDVVYDYSIGSDRSELSMHSELARLGIRTLTVLRFLPPDGAVRAFEYTGDPGLIRLDPRWHQSALRFVKLGFVHILDGIDHLLFLLCLVIPFRRAGQLVLIVTSFTVAHSITLIASAFDAGPNALWFPPLIETLIAMSIVYMALENIVLMFGQQKALVLNVQRRWMITFAFGLVHGFGFSFALRETLQFAGSHLLTSLLSFNVGVELGQLLVLGVMIPALYVLFRFVNERIGAIILSALIAHTAWHWMTERGSRLGGYEWPVLDAAFFAAAIRWTMLVVGVSAVVWLVRGALRPRVSFLEEQNKKETRGP